MSLSILSNVAGLTAQNSLETNRMSLNQTLQALSTGKRINSGADDPAGLAIADGLQANISALTQSVRNATDGVGMLQVADGALSQITTLLNSAVSLATESSTGTVSDSQRTALQAEFASIQTEINNIGGNTTYNGQAIFGAGNSLAVYMSDSSGAGTTTVTVSLGVVNDANLGFAGGSTTPISIASNDLSTAARRPGGPDQHQRRHQRHRASPRQPGSQLESVDGCQQRYEQPDHQPDQCGKQHHGG